MRLVLASLVMIAASPAAAQELERASKQLELNATAPSACVLKLPRARALANATFQAPGDGNVRVAITRLVDPDNAQPRGVSFDLTVPAVCNASHRITARSGKGGLGRLGAAAPAAAGFIDLLPYSLELTWAGTRVERPSTAGTVSFIVPNGASGDVGLRIVTPEGGTPLVAGDYDDTIVIQLQPTD